MGRSLAQTIHHKEVLAHQKLIKIFSQNKKSGVSEKLNLKMYNEPIAIDNSPKFLGIIFDKYLNFKNQMTKTPARLIMSVKLNSV